MTSTPPQLPYAIRPNFLSGTQHQQLLDWAIANEDRFTAAKVSDHGVVPSIRKALSLRDLGMVQPAFEALVRQQFDGWRDRLRLLDFALSAIELELLAYRDGDRFALHADTYRSDEPARGDRMITAIYYFHRRPRRFSGGALRLHRLGAQAGDSGVDIVPEDNSLVIFPAWAPHEVLPVVMPSGQFADARFALNCWLYRARS